MFEKADRKSILRQEFSITGLIHAASDTGLAVRLSPSNVIDLQIIGRQVTSLIGEVVFVPLSATAVSLNVTVVNS